VTEQKTLTKTALSRLQALAKGNGLAPEAIRLVEFKEETYTLTGVLNMTPHIDVRTNAYNGRSKLKGVRVLPSFAALDEEITQSQQAFEKEDAWVKDAVAEIKKTKGFGWGQHDSLLTWSDPTTTLVATENCPSCNGTAQHPCLDCQGLGFTTCLHCEGRGRELCYNCGGNGQDPANPSNPCPICQGTHYAPCRHCNQAGRLLCITCQGKGSTPCSSCEGTGVMSREAHITKGAKLSFSLSATSGLPSGLLRAVSRFGEANLPKGHADITLVPEDPEKPQKKTTLLLEAKIPYADIKIVINGKGSLIACAGKMGRLLGVPAFLDASLKEPRRELARAAHGAIPLKAALTARALQDALKLALAGKISPNDLRRLYPVGLSGDTAKEIMGHMELALRAQTRQLRLIIAACCLVASGAIFALFFFSPLLASLSIKTATLIKAALPVFVVGADWFVLSQAARWALKKKFPTLPLAATQSIGRTGYTTLGLVFALYVALFLAATFLRF
jgi:hypothetical protein